MNKHFLIIIGILIVLITGIFLIGYFFIFQSWLSEKEQITPPPGAGVEGILSKKNFLEELKEKGEVCRILKESKKETFLFCNNRPFYLESKEENLVYKMNGWFYLRKDSVLWNDLENCEFYDSEKIDDLNYKLTFYYPKDLNSQKITAKEYNYNLEDLKMKKLGEKDFLNIIAEKVRDKYQFLKECSAKTEINTERSEKPITLTFDCAGQEATLSVLLQYHYLSLPFFDQKELTKEEKIRFSFEKVLGDKCEIEKVELDIAYAKCDDFSVIVRYNFEPFYLAEYKFQAKEINEEVVTLFINNYGDYLTLAEIKNPLLMNQYKKPLLGNDFIRYQVNGNCITVVTSENSVEALIKEHEKIWE